MMQQKDFIVSKILENNQLSQKYIFKKEFPQIYEEIESIGFPDDFKFTQKLYHYLYDLDLNYGICQHCHHRICHFISFFRGYRDYCSKHCAQSDEKTKEKIRQTNNDKYGFDFYNQSDFAKQRMKDTCLRKYNVENPTQYKEIKEKQEITCLEKYGTRCVFQNDEIKSKIKQTLIDKYNVENPVYMDGFQEKFKKTCLDRYGKEHFSQTEQYREKIIQTNRQKYSKDFYFQTDEFLNKSTETCLEKYGAGNFSQTEQYKTKSHQTKKKNNSFHTSSIENLVDKYLTDNNINHIRQYRSELYPYACDFYLPDYDLYIEIQGHWTHGNHPFDKSNPNDRKKLEIWKSKKSKYYEIGMQTWTMRDVEKRKTASENNLNYLEIFSCDLEICIEKIKEITNRHE